MKITFTKIESNPKHALSLKKVKLIISIIPEEWKEPFNHIVVGNQRYPGEWNMPVTLSRFSRRLSIIDRGAPEYTIVECILLTLSDNSLSKEEYGGIGCKQLSTGLLKKARGQVSELMDEYKIECKEQGI